MLVLIFTAVSLGIYASYYSIEQNYPILYSVGLVIISLGGCGVMGILAKTFKWWGNSW
jgi:hypothetical protein